MKAVMLGAQAIRLGDRDVVMAGGMECMSKIPHYQYSRVGNQYGHGQIVDGIMHDALTDVYNNMLMGSCVEKTNTDLSISREAQDDYAIMSYNRAREAQAAGIFKNEIVNLSMTDRRR